VREAYKFADEAHLGQFRASGQPYITHPLAVAGLCADWRLDAQAIMAALMHDTIEDQGIKKSELIEKFGAPTADLVDGLTKLDKLHFSTREESQAESFRKMLLAMARDVRVILIKLADRLHNMRTMQAMAPAKRHRIARETLDIYAPIAHRLGLNQMYRELQELCFELLHPWRHAALAKAVQARARPPARHRRARAEGSRKGLRAQKIKVQVSGREKTIYSIYRKMREKHAGFAQVSDIFGFRIVVPTLTECYLSRWVCCTSCTSRCRGASRTTSPSPRPTATRACTPRWSARWARRWSSRCAPRPCTRWPRRASRRTGSTRAAKRPRASPTVDAQRLSTMWLQSLLEIQDETRDAAEFLEHVKIDLYPDAVYVFTPRSKILALPRGATPVDFAYAIHSDVGQHTVAAKINGEPAALRTELRSGDVVEIITAPGAKPQPGLAEHGAHRPRAQQDPPVPEEHGAEESRAMGEKMLAQALRAEGLQLPSPDPTTARRRAVAAAHALERQPPPRRPDGGHRPGPQDRHHRGQAAGAADAGARHQARRGDA
jgi:guanosine-3',5'-bis(diphosphate) 3'-pyrophosphohydrolase